MAQVTTTPGAIPTTVRSRLAALRRRIITWFLIDGAGRLCSMILAIALLDFLIDRMLRMDVPQRAIMLVLITAAVLYLFWRWLVRPFLHRPGDDALVLKVEDRHGELGQSLISSVQFSRLASTEHQGVSAAMVQATIDHGVKSAEQIRFSDALNNRRLFLNLLMLALAVTGIGLCGAAVATTQTGATWFQRNILLQDTPWPGVHLVVEGLNDEGEMVVVRGDDWNVGVRAVNQHDDEFGRLVTNVKSSVKDFLGFENGETKLADNLRVLLDFEGGRPSQQMRIREDAQRSDSTDAGSPDESEVFLAKFETEVRNVTQPFQFRVRAEVENGRDHSTGWINVKLVEPPGAIEQTITITPPEYTKSDPYPLPEGHGPYYVLDGSSMTLSGKANKPLSSGVLRLATSSRRRQGDESVTTRQWPMSISGGNQFSVSVAADELATAVYEVVFTDSNGLTSPRPATFGLRKSPDQPPRVKARLNGITRMVVPGARIPFWNSASDKHAVEDVWIHYNFSDAQGNAENEGDVRFDSVKDKLGQPDVTFNEVWELQPLDLPTGETLTFHFFAKDNDTYSEDKQPGKSKEYLLRVVSEEELRTDLLRREKELRDELKRLIDNQDDLWIGSRALAADLSTDPEMDSEKKHNLMTIQRRQKVIGTNTASIAKRLQGFIDEILNNRLEEEGGAFQDRLENKIIKPLTNVAELEIPIAVAHLDRARLRADQHDERDAALQEAANQQENIIQAMREVMVHMVKAEGYQEAVNALYEIEKEERGVHKLTKERHKELIERILEQGKGSEDSPDKEEGKN